MIARALVCRPELLIADEPTTALDVTTETQILQLMQDLQDDLGMAMLFITHDMGVIAEMAQEVIVMYLGRIVERADVHSLFHDPKHPYTQALLAAVPRPEVGRRRPAIKGEILILLDRPRGCALAPRCPHAMPVCREVDPPLREIAPGRMAACHLYATP